MSNNLFTFATRGIPDDKLYQLLDESWNIDRLNTIKLIFFLRDCRGGRGERKIFAQSVQWLLMHNRTDIIEANIHNIPHYGTWKDVLLLMRTDAECYALGTAPLDVPINT